MHAVCPTIARHLAPRQINCEFVGTVAPPVPVVTGMSEVLPIVPVMDDTNARGEEPTLTPEGPPRDRTTYGVPAPTVEAILDALDATSYGGQVDELAFRHRLRLPRGSATPPCGTEPSREESSSGHCGNSSPSVCRVCSRRSCRPSCTVTVRGKRLPNTGRALFAASARSWYLTIARITTGVGVPSATPVTG
jgi:hypothetical protein